MSRKKPAPESLDWFTQKPATVVCGAVAIMNARLWRGEKITLRDLPKLVAELDISIEKDGISGSDLNRYISLKRNFGVQRIIQPNFRSVESLLRDNFGMILRYRWEVNQRSGLHYVFVCRGARSRVLVANPHRFSASENYQKWRYFKPIEFKDCIKKYKTGNRNLPWIWPIARD